jgi:hypothetical protein
MESTLGQCGNTCRAFNDSDLLSHGVSIHFPRIIVEFHSFWVGDFVSHPHQKNKIKYKNFTITVNTGKKLLSKSF